MARDDQEPDRNPRGPGNPAVVNESPKEVPRGSKRQGWVIVACLIAVTGSSIASDMLPSSSGWTSVDREILRKVVQGMSNQETIEVMKRWKESPEASDEKYQAALDLIIKAFSGGESNAN